MWLPLINAFDMHDRTALYDALFQLGPECAWKTMDALHKGDLPGYFAQTTHPESLETLTNNAFSWMRLLTGLRPIEVTRAAADFAHYGPRMQMHLAYITLWLSDPDALSKIIEERGLPRFTDMVAQREPIILMPLHLSAAYAINPLVARHASVEAVFNRLNFDEIKRARFPDLPLTAFPLNEGNTLRRALAAMRAGKVFSIFPELDPRGRDDHHVEVTLMGTTVMAPAGPVIMAQMAKAKIQVVTIKHLENGRFALTYHPAISPPVRRQDVTSVVQEVWSVLSAEMYNGQLSEWEMWYEFDRLIVQEDLGATT